MDHRYASTTPDSLASAAIRSTAAMMDMQIGMMRQLMSLQTRSAAAFGIPDCTDFLNTSVDCQRRVMSMTTDQVLNTSQRITETMTDLQRQFARLFEQQAKTVTDEMCRGLDRWADGAEETLRSAGQQVSAGAQEIERAATDAARQGSPIVRASETGSESRQKEAAKR